MKIREKNENWVKCPEVILHGASSHPLGTKKLPV